MANPFEVQTINPLQALLVGDQAYQGAQKRGLQQAKDQSAQMAAQQWQAGDKQGALATLLQGNNFDAANAYGTVDQREYTRGRDTRQDARQTGRDAVDDRFREESLRLQKAAAARAGEDKFTIKEITDPNTGATTLVRVNQRGAEGPINTGLPPTTGGGNPFGGGKFNEGQGKAAGFTDRMLQSEAILSGKAPETGIGPVSPGADLEGTSLSARGMSKVPVVGNYAVGENYQKYNQAKADFINAQLRRESGAAIAPSEFASADAQYFPRPGDSPQVIEQKRANRKAAISAMGREGGPSYRPEATFREDGALASTKPRIAPAQAPSTAQAPQLQPQQAAPLNNGATATNPKTGERIIFQNGQWVPFT